MTTHYADEATLEHIRTIESQLAASEEARKAAEQRIKNSQAQKPYETKYRHSGHCLYSVNNSSICETYGCIPVRFDTYEQPIIPPELEALQRENVELTKENKLLRIEITWRIEE